MSNVFYVSVHSDNKIYTNQYKKVISSHSLYVQTKRGRKSGRTCAGSFVINKLSEALMDCGAVPLKDINPRSKYSARPATFFVTQLEPYWEDAITDLAKVGVRIYVLPVAGAVDGMPDAVSESFNAYYTDKFERYLAQAKKGSDVRDLLEVAIAMARLFECADITLNSKQKDLVGQIYEICNATSPSRVAETTDAPTTQTPALQQDPPQSETDKKFNTPIVLNVEDDF